MKVEIEVKEKALKYIDELEEMFSTAGWKNLVEEARAQIYQYQADATMVNSWEAVCELRGQISQLSRLVNLEEVTAMMKANYMAEDYEDEDEDSSASV